jgi:MscS family membrane protein
MLKLLAVILLAGSLQAQTPVPETTDPLGRGTPQESVRQFLEACHRREYAKALSYLDLRRMTPAQRAKDGSELAMQLEDLLDDTAFDITTLSRDPAGDQSDGLAAPLDHLATFQVDKESLELQLERVELKPGYRVWLVSAASVELIPKAHQAVGETPFEKDLPQGLVTFEILDTPVWRWIALFAMVFVFWAAAGFLSWALVTGLRRLSGASAFRGPVRVALTAAALRAGMEFAPPAVLPRTFLERALAMLFVLALAWIAGVILDMASERWRTRLDPRMQAVMYSVLPLGRQIAKLSLFLLAILGLLSVWGYNTTTILAGVGVGGLAVALAAQKTIENLFGGISVIGDRPVLVGDVCRFGGRVGEVMHIGLRSTRIRTPDRTIIVVPNSQFSAMELENISGRDKIWFHPVLNLRRDTTSDQLLEVLDAFRKVLASYPNVEIGKLPVRFIGVGPYSLDVEIVAYVSTKDNDEFLALQQEMLLKFLQAVEHAGTSLAVPLTENFEAQRARTQ